MIPLFVLTGFLGSGKTTLLAQLLRQPALSDTAVIINELGEVGLDHDLVRTSDENLVALTTGCLCCQVRGDLVATLQDLLARRDRGQVQPFQRIVIETSGAAEPGPILHAVMTTPDLAARLAIDGIVTVVDAVMGAATLDREPISVKQVAVADRIVVSKTDLTGGVPEDLSARLAAINRPADVLVQEHGRTDTDAILASAGAATAGGGGRLEAWLDAYARTPRDATDDPGASHLDGITAVAVMRDRPLPAVALTLFLEALAEQCGADILRLKGIVAVAETPTTPAIVQGVQHLFHPVTWLERWPSRDERTRIVLIGRRVQPTWVEALLDAIVAEIEETAPAPLWPG